MENQVLYADFEPEGNDLFVVSPEGNYFNFPSAQFNENSEPTQIVDPKSHKIYTVIFNE